MTFSDAIAQLDSDLSELAIDTGSVNLSLIQREINNLVKGGFTPANVQVMLGQARAAIRAAIDNAGGLPGATARAKILELLGSSAVQTDKDAFQKGVTGAFIEYNAVAEGNSTLAATRAKFFSEVMAGLKALPRSAAVAITGAVGDAVSGALTNPMGLAAILGGIGLLYVFFVRRRA